MTERIASPSRTREIIEKNHFFFKKNFGQNFLIDSNILENIIQAAQVTKEDFILEIGPGIGSLTQCLAENAKEVAAVEIDRNLIPILHETLKDYDNIEIIHTDILKLDLNKLIEEKNGAKAIKIVANLPYYITTPIIMELLEKKHNVKSITVMVQKEVAKRMQAAPKTKDYGALSIAVQYYAQVQIDKIVPACCFMPKPNVDSAVITLSILQKPQFYVKDEEFFFRIVKCAFGQRRKTLLNSLLNQCGLGLTKQRLTEVLCRAGLEEKIRGEALSIEQFCHLSNLLLEEI